MRVEEEKSRTRPRFASLARRFRGSDAALSGLRVWLIVVTARFVHARLKGSRRARCASPFPVRRGRGASSRRADKKENAEQRQSVQSLKLRRTLVDPSQVALSSHGEAAVTGSGSRLEAVAAAAVPSPNLPRLAAIGGFGQVVVGPPGSGKSTWVAAAQRASPSWGRATRA